MYFLNLGVKGLKLLNLGYEPHRAWQLDYGHFSRTLVNGWRECWVSRPSCTVGWPMLSSCPLRDMSHENLRDTIFRHPIVTFLQFRKVSKTSKGSRSYSLMTSPKVESHRNTSLGSVSRLFARGHCFLFVLITYHIFQFFNSLFFFFQDFSFRMTLESMDRRPSGFAGFINPFTPKSDQCQISPAASPEILHHTVWRTRLFIAYSDERWLYYQFSLPHLYIFF